MNLFQSGSFVLNSGLVSNMKIECDALSLVDWNTLAGFVHAKMWWGEVIGIPRGGVPFALALDQYTTDMSDTILIVDDVLTSGGSMERMREQVIEERGNDLPIKGVVAFARNPCPDWIRPVFQLWP